MNNSILLSICIPTYNRDEVVKKCISDILELQLNDIEIVVSNNASTDKTEQYLKTYIKDGAITYTRNTSNIGYINIYEVMRKANGKYCFLLSDEDALIKEGIEDLLSFLKTHDDIGFLQTNYIPKYKQNYIAHKSAISNLATRAVTYMSGQIFLKAAIPTIPSNIHNNYLFLHYPHNYLAYKILNDYNGVLYKKATCIVSARNARQNDSTMYGLSNNILEKLNCECDLINEAELSQLYRYKSAIVCLKKYYQYLSNASDNKCNNYKSSKNLLKNIIKLISTKLKLNLFFKTLFKYITNIWFTKKTITSHK